MHTHLPRLSPEHYRGMAWVHWSFAIRDRATGWLNESFHVIFRATFQEHAAARDIGCLAYCLMPDHVHLLLCGLTDSSDQRLFTRAFRRAIGPALAPCEWQKQSYDNVIRERERNQGALLSVAHYIGENPVRAALTKQVEDWRFRGSWLPGIGWLDPCAADFAGRFWGAYNAIVERS